MKRGTMVFLAGIFSALVMSGCDKDDEDNNGNSFNATDSSFVLMASMSNYAEISAGRVAAEKAEDPAIAAYGEMMVTDHTDAGQQLKSIADNIGLKTKDSLDAEHVRLMDTLADLSNAEFDSVYIHSQIRDHQKAINLFQNEAANGQHSELKQFATDLLPHLQMHFMKADSLANTVQTN